MESNSIAVLAPGSRQELREFLSEIDFLYDLRIIVIATDRDVETTAIAHQLRPRYLTCLNGAFNELVAVVDKMVRRYNRKGGEAYQLASEEIYNGYQIQLFNPPEKY